MMKAYLLQVLLCVGLGVASVAHGDTLVVGALGDSISVATNSSGWGSKPEFSWSTGTGQGVKSHLFRLKALEPARAIRSLNVAFGGAKAADLPAQVERLVSHRPHYATILIGANDLCQWDDAADENVVFQKFEENVNHTVRRLTEIREDAKILMVPIPNMENLRVVGKEDGCQWLWDLFDICPGLLHSDRTDEERAVFLKRLTRANNVLKDVGDRYEKNVRFNANLADAVFEAKHVSSRDCFHPSVEGQNYLADLTWEEGWFAAGEKAKGANIPRQ